MPKQLRIENPLCFGSWLPPQLTEGPFSFASPILIGFAFTSENYWLIT